MSGGGDCLGCAALWRLGRRRHFSSRDKDGGHTVRSAIAENPCYTQTSRLLSFMESELLQIKVLHCENMDFCVFLRKIVENIKFSTHTAKLMQRMLKHIFWPITNCSSLYTIDVTGIQSVVLRQIGGRGHFRSRDKDGGHTVRSAIAENPQLYANVTTLSHAAQSHCTVNAHAKISRKMGNSTPPL